MTLFDEHVDARTVALKRREDPEFDWANRSAIPGIARLRAILESWFQTYPEDKRAEFVTRFRSRDDATHEGALFELFLCALMQGCGFNVEIEPALQGGSVPDLRLDLKGRPVAYLEATTQQGMHEQRQQDSALRRLLEDASRHTRVPGFIVMAGHVVPGKDTCSPKRLAAWWDNWFASVDHAKVRAECEGHGRPVAQRTFHDEKTGWRITFDLCPLESPDKKPEMVVGAFSVAWWTPSRERLRESIRGKRRQHKHSDLPLVVAVAANDFVTEPNQGDIAEALAGTVVHTVTWGDPEHRAVPSRQADGIWPLRDGKRPRDPIGIIMASVCRIRNLATIRACLWDNPWLSESELLRPWSLDRAYWDTDGSLRQDARVAAAELLGIPKEA